MIEKKSPGMTLDYRIFKRMDKAIKKHYGLGIGEIAEIEPTFAFKAMRTGFTAVFTQRGHRELIQQDKVDNLDGSTLTTGVTNREMYRETAFEGVVNHAMGGVIDAMIRSYESSDSDFVISVLRQPGLIGRIRRQEPYTEVVALIPRRTE